MIKKHSIVLAGLAILIYIIIRFAVTPNAVSDPYILGQTAAIAAGVMCLAISLHVHLKYVQIGLNTLDRTDRKQVEQSFAKGALPHDKRLHKIARANANHRLATQPATALVILIAYIGVALLHVSIRIVDTPTKSGLSQLWSMGDIIRFVIYALILLFTWLRIAEHARSVLVGATSPPPMDGDDDRYWTGIW